jgi:thioredoxin reductase (NADPH)
MPEEDIDIAIIGCGPAGLQAAIHARGKKANAVVFGKPNKSSMYKAHVGNYCFYEEVLDGKDLLEVGMKQAEGLGARFVQEDVIETKLEDKQFTVVTEEGNTFISKALILAMGIARKKLRVKGEKELVGQGVSYCVDCDAMFYRQKDVAVVGNESAAVSGALTLLGFAKKVHLICRELNISNSLKNKLEKSDVEVISGNWVKAINGKKAVESLLLKNGDTLPVDGIFIELGAKGAMELAANLGAMFDAETFSYIDTNKKQETNIPGLYAAGDIAGEPWQIAKAVGEGCIAGIEAAKYAKKISDS